MCTDCTSYITDKLLLLLLLYVVVY